MTWQKSHPFKLSTLMEFRTKLGIGTQVHLNIAYVNPIHCMTYRQRDKASYLAKGEQVDQPILKGKTVVLNATDVEQMWNSTHIHVAYPEGNNWMMAIRHFLGRDSEI
jgi:hypothetical protein